MARVVVAISPGGKKKQKKEKKTRAFATCLRGGLLTLLFEVRAGAAKFAT